MLKHFFATASGSSRLLVQQDGSTTHTARVTETLLRQYFPNRLISKNRELRWVPKFPEQRVTSKKSQ